MSDRRSEEFLSPSFETLEGLPADPHLTINPGRSAFLGTYPSSFPTYRMMGGTADDGAAAEKDDSGAASRDSQGSLAELEELSGIAKPVTSIGDLELQETLAQGGFGEVWLGEQKSLRRTVAVKRLRRDQLLGSTAEQRQAMRFLFQQEALTTARLEHPNIVPVYQLLSDGANNPLLSMKWVKGRAWNDLLLEERDQPVRQFLARHLPILIDVAQAVAFAHSQGILHRDIKPHQVMVGEFGEVLLMDWGLAIPFGEVAAADTPGGGDRDVSSGGFPGPAGTPSFMAPEQAHGDFRSFGPWTDLYLLGGVLYFLLTGSAPHKAPTSMAALLLAAKSDVPPPSERVDDRHLPDELVDLAMATLRADPTERAPGSVQEFIEKLQEYLSGASRRRRARSLLHEVEGESPGDDYVVLEHQLARLREADVLWPEHPGMATARDRLLHAYVGLALEEKDLRLARVQAEQLADADRRRQALQRIDGALQKRGQEARQRRLALVGLVAVMVLLVAGGVKYVLDQRQANERLLAQRDAARQARLESEGLMSYMMDDLWGRLSQIERVDILASVANRAQQYYGQRQLSDLSGEEILNLGSAMSNLAEVLGGTGQFTEAIATQERAVQALADLQSHPTLGPVARAEQLAARLYLAGLHRDSGRTETALAMFEELVSDIDAWLAVRPDDEDVMELLAASRDGWGVLLYDQGKVIEAKELFEASRDQYLALHRRDPERGIDQDAADVAFRIGVTLKDLGQLSAAASMVREARGVLADVLVLDPNRADAAHHLVFFDTILAEIMVEQGRFQEAKELAEASLVPMRSALRQVPEDVETRYSMALLEWVLGRAEEGLGASAAARRAWLRGVDIVETAIEMQPDLDHAYLLDTLVRLRRRLGQDDAVRPMVEELCAKGWSHQGFSEFCAEP